jgi:hypothetical protein
VKRHGTTEAQSKALPPIGIGLGVASIEGMGNPLTNTKTANHREHLILCLADMEHHGKIVIARQPALCCKEGEHFLSIQARHMVIETDLPDRDKFGVMPEAVQRIVEVQQCVVAQTFDIHRMNAQGEVNLGMTVSQHGDSVEVGWRNGRHQNRGHTSPSATVKGSPYTAKYAGDIEKIEMAVAVDQHR